MQRKFSFVPGEFYHVYNRGVEKRDVFLETPDWRRFQSLLYLCNSDKTLVYKLIQGEPLEYDRGEEIVSIFAYTLMANHFHIVAKENRLGGLSKFMGRLLTSYSMYFNIKYERSGALMCRPFRAKHISDDAYLRWVLSYVHLNPLGIKNSGLEEAYSTGKSRAEDTLSSFRYSSYQDYFLGTRPETRILNKIELPIDIADLESVDEMLREVRAFQGDSLE